MDDDKPLSGAQFARQVGTDPEKWAVAFLRATCGWTPESPTTDRQREVAHAFGFNTRDDRVALVAGWFRDAMEAAVRAAHDDVVKAVKGSVLSHDWDSKPSD